MLDEARTEWTFESMGRARDVLLILAFCVPVAGLALGSAMGVPLDRLGGVMVAYWALVFMSLFAAAVEFAKRSRGAGSRLLLIGTIIILPVGAKVASGVFAQPIPITQSAPEAASNVQVMPVKGCKPELVTREPLSVTDSKNGKSGRLAWYLWIGNYYEWKFQLYITADNDGASGRASVDAVVSSWYSVLPHAKSVTAFARGTIECKPGGSGCTCFADSSSDRKTEGDFVVSVDVQGVMVPMGANLKVVSSADLSGTMALSGLSVGQDPVHGTLQSPNTARGGISKSKGYSYRCIEF